jgi:hypothetical protein
LRGLFVLGDKGYQGCRNVYFMRKRQRGQAELPARDKAYNVTMLESCSYFSAHFETALQQNYCELLGSSIFGLRNWLVLWNYVFGSSFEYIYI